MQAIDIGKEYSTFDLVMQIKMNNYINIDFSQSLSNPAVPSSRLFLHSYIEMLIDHFVGNTTREQSVYWQQFPKERHL